MRLLHLPANGSFDELWHTARCQQLSSLLRYGYCLEESACSKASGFLAKLPMTSLSGCHLADLLRAESLAIRQHPRSAAYPFTVLSTKHAWLLLTRKRFCIRGRLAILRGSSGRARAARMGRAQPVRMGLPQVEAWKGGKMPITMGFASSRRALFPFTVAPSQDLARIFCSLWGHSKPCSTSPSSDQLREVVCLAGTPAGWCSN